MSTTADQFDELLNNIASADSNDDEFEALHEVIEALWQHLPNELEATVLAGLEKTAAKARKWALEADGHECDECGKKVLNLVLCPDGAEICQACFDAGKH